MTGREPCVRGAGEPAMPVRPVAALLDATTRHRKASAYSLLAGFVFGFGWLVWIDAAVRGPYLWTPDGWRTLVVSGVSPAQRPRQRARAWLACWHRALAVRARAREREREHANLLREK